MKIVVLVISLVMGTASIALAEDLAIAADMPVIANSFLTGVIKSVTWADPDKGTRSEIVIKNAAGKLNRILVTSTTTLWDSETKPIMPDRILPKSKVNVIYITTPEGIKIAKSIKILK